MLKLLSKLCINTEQNFEHILKKSAQLAQKLNLNVLRICYIHTSYLIHTKHELCIARRTPINDFRPSPQQ